MVVVVVVFVVAVNGVLVGEMVTEGNARVILSVIIYSVVCVVCCLDGEYVPWWWQYMYSRVRSE